mgnify:CR=1 FL=1
MANFAKLGLNSKVKAVLVVNDNIATTEQNGIDFLIKLFNYHFWVQTYEDGNIRKNCASVGDTYDEDRDAFIAPKPYASWILNEETCRWEAPSAMPDDGKKYEWNESTTSWDEIV